MDHPVDGGTERQRTGFRSAECFVFGDGFAAVMENEQGDHRGEGNGQNVDHQIADIGEDENIDEQAADDGGEQCLRAEDCCQGDTPQSAVQKQERTNGRQLGNQNRDKYIS